MKAIVLAGGGGTRLFPLSTEDCPKQFLELIDGKSLLLNTVERLNGLCETKDIVIVTNEKYALLTKKVLKDGGIEGAHIITEPARKNTAPAIVLAVKYCVEKLGIEENEPMIVLPSDHAVSPIKVFAESVVRLCESAVKTPYLFTFGVKPTRPDTNYGYIRFGQAKEEYFMVSEFTEKPDAETARNYIKKGDYFWNAGIYCFTLLTLLKELKVCCPELFGLYGLPFEEFLSRFVEAPVLAFDYAVSEKSVKMAVMPLFADWCDVGNWESFYFFSKKDKDGNAVIGDVRYRNCRNCLLISYGGTASADGLKNSCMIQRDAQVLVRRMDTNAWQN